MTRGSTQRGARRNGVVLLVTWFAISLVGCGGEGDAPLGPGGIGAARSTAETTAVPIDVGTTTTSNDEAPADINGGAATDIHDGTATTSNDEAAADIGVGAATPSDESAAQPAEQSQPSVDGSLGLAPAPLTNAATAPTTDVPPLPERSATLAFTGDVLAHSPLWRGATANAGGTGYDFRPMFAEIAPVIARADLAICHLETPIAPEGEELSTDPLYGVPPEIVEGIASAGHDRCSTASNHVLDRGVAGIDRTIEVLEQNGLGQSGSARTPAEIEPRLFDVAGISMAHLSYTYATNGIPVPAGEPWRTRLIDPEQIVDDAASARALGSEFTVVSLHWGKEKSHEPTAEQRAIADRLTASGFVDLIVGHHAHVVQPIEQINGVWVAFGLGDILSNLPAADHWPAASQDGIVVEFEVTAGGGVATRVAPPTVTPTWVDKESGWVVRDVRRQLSDPALADWRREMLESSFARTSAIVGTFIG